MKIKKHWIGNHLAQACIIFMMGITFFATSKTGNVSYIAVIPLSVVSGMIIASMKPKVYCMGIIVNKQQGDKIEKINY